MKANRQLGIKFVQQLLDAANSLQNIYSSAYLTHGEVQEIGEMTNRLAEISDAVVDSNFERMPTKRSNETDVEEGE